jgi:hypothetical protein
MTQGASQYFESFILAMELPVFGAEPSDSEARKTGGRQPEFHREKRRTGRPGMSTGGAY